jgi:hypothetical protein
VSPDLIFLDEKGGAKLGLPQPGAIRSDQLSLAAVILQQSSKRPFEEYWAGRNLNRHLVSQDLPWFRQRYTAELDIILTQLLEEKPFSELA